MSCTAPICCRPRWRCAVGPLAVPSVFGARVAQAVEHALQLRHVLLRFVHAPLAGRLARLLRLPVQVPVGEVLRIRVERHLVVVALRLFGQRLQMAVDRLLAAPCSRWSSACAVGIGRLADRLVERIPRGLTRLLQRPRACVRSGPPPGAGRGPTSAAAPASTASGALFEPKQVIDRAEVEEGAVVAVEGVGLRISPPALRSASSRSSGCRLRSSRGSPSAIRDIGFWNGRSGRTNSSASALPPVCPSASRAISCRGYRESRPWMRRQVLLADAVRGLRRTARQREADHQRRCIRPIAQPQFGLQRRPRRSRRPSSMASGVCWLPAARPGGSLQSAAGGWSAITVSAQAASSRPLRRTHQAAAFRQVPVGLEARLVERAEWLRAAVQRQASGTPSPPVTFTVRRAPAGTDTAPPSDLRKIGASRV